MIKQIKNWIIFWITAWLSILLVWISYAAWVNLSTVTDWDSLTADAWNSIVNQVNVFWSEDQEIKDSFAHLWFTTSETMNISWGNKIPFDRIQYWDSSLLSNNEYIVPSSWYYYIGMWIYYITDNNARVFLKINWTIEWWVQMTWNWWTRFPNTSTILYLNEWDRIYAEVLDHAAYADLTMWSQDEHSYMRIMRIR